MNSPRLKLSGLPRRSTPQDANGSPPTVRPREPLTPAAPASPGRAGARRLLQPLPAAGIALVLIALVGYLGVYSASTKRTQVLLATHALSPGTVLTASDVRSGGIAAEGSVLAALLPAGERFAGSRAAPIDRSARRRPIASGGARWPPGADLRLHARGPRVRPHRGACKPVIASPCLQRSAPARGQAIDAPDRTERRSALRW